MRVLNCMQGSPEWVDARCGKVTASRAGEILTDKTLKIGAAARTYAAELVAETLIGGPDPWRMQGETVDMRRGTFTEAEARKFFQLELDCDVEEVGCIIHDNDRWAASPDGLVGVRSGLELKCPAPKTQIKWLLDGGLPIEHRAQCHMGMIVAERGHWWFLSYCVGLPPLLVEVHRDDYTTKLEAALNEFNGIYDDMLARIIAQRDKAIDAAIDHRGDQLPPDLRGLVPAANQFEPQPF